MNAVTPVGWPPLSEIMLKSIAHGIPIHVRAACLRARAVRDDDQEGKNARFVTPPNLVALVKWADKVISE